MRESGDVLNDRYRIERVLGKGGMGAVYLATHLHLEEPVAVKELQIPKASARLLEAAEKQFRSEARILNRLRHPNLPRVYDFFELDGHLYLVMDYIRGKNLLQTVTENGPCSQEQALDWARQLCDVLGYLHTQQPPIIFRDLKPDNIMLEPEGVIRLIDFGIAKVFDADQGRLTETVLRAATHGFAAAEQYGDGGTDARSDIYSLGATLYAMLAYRIPPSALALALGQEELDPLGLVREDLDAQLLTAIDWMMQPRQEMRPPTIADVQEALGFAGQTLKEPTTSLPLQVRRLMGEEFQYFFPLKDWLERRGLLGAVMRAMQTGANAPMVALRGGPGLGKSRLLKTAIGRLADRFRALPVAHAGPVARHVPFGALLGSFSAFLGRHRGEVEDALRQLSPQELHEAAQSMPVLKPLVAEAAIMAVRGPMERARSVMAVILCILETMSVETPVLLAIDDWQYVDEATLKLVDTLRTGVSSARVALMVAYEETADSPFCREFIERWERKGDLVSVALPPLARDELGGYLGEALPPIQGMDMLVGDLYEASLGNPLMVEELLRFLVVRRLISERQGALVLSDFSSNLLPRSLEDVTRRRREHLTLDAQDVLSYASVIGPRFDLRTVIKLSESSVTKVLDALTEAVRALFLTGEENSRYAFTSEAARRVFYDVLPGPRRMALHRKMGTLEEKRAATAGEMPSAGYYFEQAGEVDKSLEVLAKLSQELQTPRTIEVMVGDAIKLKGFKDTLLLSAEQVKGGLNALGMLVRSMKGLETYGAKSPITMTSFGTALGVIRGLVDARGTLGFSLSEEAFHINQNEVPLGLLPGGVKALLNRHKISGFEFQPGVHEQELKAFVELLLMTREGVQGSGGWTTMCEHHGIEHIVVNETVYIGVAEKDLFDTAKLKSADEIVIKTASSEALAAAAPVVEAPAPTGLEGLDSVLASLQGGNASSEVLLSRLDRLRDLLQEIKASGAGVGPGPRRGAAPAAAPAEEVPDEIHEVLRQARVDEVLQLVGLMKAIDVPLKTFLETRPELLMKGLQDEDPNQRLAAAMGILKMGSSARRWLVNYLKTSDHFIGRATAIFLFLRAEADPGMVMSLEVLACAEPEEAMRLLDAMTLGELPWAIPLASVLVSPVRPLRRAGLEFLLNCKMDRAVKLEFLQSALLTEHPVIMEDAVAALGEVGGEGAVTILVNLARKISAADGGAPIRTMEMICHACGRIGSPKALPFLKNVLKKGLLVTSQDPAVRAAAVLALRNISGDEALELVRKHASDAEKNVSFTARHMLANEAPAHPKTDYEALANTLEKEGMPEVKR
ncbi:MAG TPA: protein kinase [Candidatus Xenobia bacterium]|jgi:serine/threonine-protein kinase